MQTPPAKADTLEALAEQARLWSQELGFTGFGICGIDLSSEKENHLEWLRRGYHGDMQWLEENQDKRFKPDLLVENTLRIISVRLHYLPENTDHIKILKSREKAYISRYTLGRDYHKLMRKRLAKLGKKIENKAHTNALIQSANTRAFVDSAPVLERPIAERAGIGWTGKHTLVLDKEQGSWFFLGELFTNIPLPINTHTVKNECGECKACLQVCPTDAFPKPYQLDATRCISYLTIEHKGSIPEAFREPIGNRIFGCDDCQAICPWNKYAKKFTEEKDFQPRHQLHNIDLLSLFQWDETDFLHYTEGSAIRRVGFERWQRNIAVALGNAPKDPLVLRALSAKQASATPMVREHIAWAITRQNDPRPSRRKIKRAQTTSSITKLS